MPQSTSALQNEWMVDYPEAKEPPFHSDGIDEAESFLRSEGHKIYRGLISLNKGASEKAERAALFLVMEWDYDYERV